MGQAAEEAARNAAGVGERRRCGAGAQQDQNKVRHAELHRASILDGAARSIGLAPPLAQTKLLPVNGPTMTRRWTGGEGRGSGMALAGIIDRLWRLTRGAIDDHEIAA
jgi:hypothetical protein